MRPLTTLRRTPAERADVHLSWQRPDLPFFAAGACHILAFAFLERWPRSGFGPRFIRPVRGQGGSHVYVSNRHLAFDAQGYVPESELLAAHCSAFLALSPEWSADVDVLDIEVPLAEFCAAHQHRAPWDFPPGVWARAHAFLSQVPAPPSRA